MRGREKVTRFLICSTFLQLGWLQFDISGNPNTLLGKMHFNCEADVEEAWEGKVGGGRAKKRAAATTHDPWDTCPDDHDKLGFGCHYKSSSSLFLS